MLTRAVQFLQHPLHASQFLCGIMKYHQVREIDEFRVSGDVFKYTHITYLSVEQSQTIRLLSQNPSLIDNCGPEKYEAQKRFRQGGMECLAKNLDSQPPPAKHR